LQSANHIIAPVFTLRAALPAIESIAPAARRANSPIARANQACVMSWARRLLEEGCAREHRRLQ
jgi:hypothetical protein